MSEQGFSPPSIDPASKGDLTGTVRFILTKFLQGVDDMLPARIVAYDRATNRAQVQPLISIVTTTNQRVEKAQIASVPVLQLGGGGFVLSFPLNAGDLGWIKANDRDISLFLQSKSSAPPNTQRKHSFEDALFIPDTMLRQVTIDPEDEEAVTLQSLDGSIKIALHSDSISIKSPMINMDSTLNVSGDVIASGISLVHHVHSGVQSGSNNSGEPV